MRRGNVIITDPVAIKRALIDQALNPPRKQVTQDEFDQIVYDAIWRDKTQPPAAHVRWANRNYELIERKKCDK